MYPYFMLYGMSYDEYWNGPAKLTSAYYEYHRLKTEDRNHELWWQGKYFLDALLTVSPFKKGKHTYPDKPTRITPLSEEEKEQEKEENLKRLISYLDGKADAWSRQNAK